MKTKRIDQYICIDTDQIVIDEMKDILKTDCSKFMLEDDKADWKELQAAAKVIKRFYTI